MEKLAIIDEINEDKKKKYLQIDKIPKKDEFYIAYTKDPKKYIKLAYTGKEELIFKNERPYPIFKGFLDGKTSVIFISGSRGTGKSLFASGIAEDYHKLNKPNKIYLVNSTSKESDENMKHQKYIQDFDIETLNNFKILNSTKKDEIDKEDKDAESIFKMYHDCLFIFDDIDNLNKPTQRKVNIFFNLLLELSRKKNISIVKISHYETNSHESRLLLKELDYYICFNDDKLRTNRLLLFYKNIDVDIFDPSETYLIFNFKYSYCITNKRILIL
jgi:adenylate kinase family enzyme